RARITIVACAAVWFGRIRARPRRGVARAHVVALVRCRAGDWARAGAGARLAGSALCAGIPVVAWAAVRLWRVRARARRWIARTRVVALVRRGARHGIDANAHTCLAGVALRAGVAVVAWAAVRLRRVRAGARRWIARAHVVALVRCRAGDWARAGA